MDRNEQAAGLRCPRCRCELESAHLARCPRCLEELPRPDGCRGCGKCGAR